MSTKLRLDSYKENVIECTDKNLQLLLRSSPRAKLPQRRTTMLNIFSVPRK